MQIDSKVITFADSHQPWSNKYRFNKLYQLIASEKPDIVICLGDDYDMFNFGGFPRNPNIISPKDELDKGHKLNTVMWQEIAKAAPKAKLMRIGGNHNDRIQKQIIRKFPHIISLVDDSNLYDFKGVESIGDGRDFIEIDDVVYCHGWAARTVSHRNHFYKSVVHGHSHRAEIIMSLDHRTGHKPFFAVASGCMIDFNAPVFDYTVNKHTNWKHAATIIEHGFPRLVFI